MYACTYVLMYLPSFGLILASGMTQTNQREVMMEYEVREFTGRFKELGSDVLERMRNQLKSLLKSWGAVGPEETGIPVNGGMPLWMEVEFLDNIVQFEIECNPFLRSELN